MADRSSRVRGFVSTGVVFAIGVATVARAGTPDTAAAPTVSAASCALLDSPEAAGTMDGLLQYLANACGRRAEFIGQVRSNDVEPATPGREPNPDVAASNPGGDTGDTRTQSETSIARNPVSGTLCSAWNDSYHQVALAQGLSGFARSTDGGDTWDDRGPLSSDDSGDPSLVWRRLDGRFYYAALRLGGLALYRSDDDCRSFVFVSQIASGDDDKEIMAIDNDPTSPYYGRIYVVWKDFGGGGRNYSTHSTDAGATWSPQVPVSPLGEQGQGIWPTIAPNGDVYASWVRWLPPGFPAGDIEIPLARSTNGGVSYTTLAPAATGKANPRDAAATTNCGRPSLNGNVRYLPTPQIVYRGGYVHAVYSYDPDGEGAGDVVDVYYRRYNVATSSWDAEVEINDDATTTDQYQPTLSVGTHGEVSVGYYSRQNDVTLNRLLDFYSRTSYDGGATWSTPSVRLSDVSSDIVLDAQLATCYHGDYDQQLQDGTGKAHHLWSDDRGGTPPVGSGPDVYADRTLVGADFLINAAQSSASACVPADANYTLAIDQFQGFTEPVTLAAAGNPAGSSVVFGTNPVTPPGSSTVTVTTSGVAAGSSTITVTGTSAPSAIVHQTSLGLNVYTLTPTAALLITPANSATAVPVRASFAWLAVAQAADYTLEVDDEPTFAAPLTYTATVAATSHTTTADLPSNTTLYWRVRAQNSCGAGTNSVTFSFTSVALAGDCAVGETAALSAVEGFESATPAGWTLPAGIGTNTWAVSSARFRSGASSFKASSPATASDQRLVSPTIALPNVNPLSLIYYQWRDLEDQSATQCFDGGILEISTNGGSTFTQLDGQFVSDPYTGVINNSFTNPLGGLRGWCAGPTGFNRVVANLAAYAGQSVQFRFRLGSDNAQGTEGWYIDDFRVQSCSSLLFRDGFENPPPP